MRGISRRSDGKYVVRKQINGVIIAKYARTKEEAIRIRHEIRIGKIKPKKKEKNNQPTNNIKVGEYAEYWMETYKRPFINDKTFSTIVYVMKKFVSVFENQKLRDVNSEMLQQFFNKLPRGRTKEKTFVYVNSMFQQATDVDLLRKNPCKAVIKDKKVLSKNYTYTFEEQEKIINAIKGTDIEHEIMIYLMTGCRPSELPKEKDFDFVKKEVHIRGTKNYNAKHRVVDMSKAFSDYIEKYLKNNKIQQQRYVCKKFNQICASVGIEKSLLYRLRHTFASNHFALKTQPKYVQQWLGHSSISMTLDVYTDIDKTATFEKISKLYNNYYYIP